MPLSKATKMQLSELIHYIDYTRLVDADTDENIIAFCEQADNVAAICIFSQYIKTAKAHIHKTPIATVANFPKGTDTIETTATSISNSLKLGADEIDVVMPYHLLIADQLKEVSDFLTHCRTLTQGHILKVIIESGALNPQQIKTATQLVINSGADFVKTSTGKIEQGASLPAAKIILETLKQHPNPPGIKFSGGIRTTEQAFEYVTLVKEIMGEDWITPQHLRFGASALGARHNSQTV